MCIYIYVYIKELYQECCNVYSCRNMHIYIYLFEECISFERQLLLWPEKHQYRGCRSQGTGHRRCLLAGREHPRVAISRLAYQTQHKAVGWIDRDPRKGHKEGQEDRGEIRGARVGLLLRVA